MDPYVGEIRLFSGNYVPPDWAACNGQLLAVQQYQVLFAVIGNMYGGDGVKTFAVPNLSAQVPLGAGAGPGLTPRTVTQKGGTPTVMLTAAQTPVHSHPVACGVAAPATTPTANVWANSARTAPVAYGQNIDSTMAPQGVGAVGGNMPHNNVQPYLALTFMIALQGIFPSKP